MILLLLAFALFIALIWWAIASTAKYERERKSAMNRAIDRMRAEDKAHYAEQAESTIYGTPPHIAEGLDALREYNREAVAHITERTPKPAVSELSDGC